MAARPQPKRITMNHLPRLFAPVFVPAFAPVFALALAAATPGTAAQSAAPAIAVPHVAIATDQVYSTIDGTPLHCDVYTPQSSQEAEAAQLRPAVLVIHGGAWSAGSRRTMSGYALRLARAGIVAVAIDYRLAPQWKFPAQVDDVRAALLWMVQQADHLGIDPQRIGLFGYSAGGHLACMIGTLVDESLETQATTSNWQSDDPRFALLPQPLAICAGGPPCDLAAIPAANTGLAYFLGGSPAEVPEVYHAASPVSHASAGDAPTLIIHGERDGIVPLQSSKALYRAQQQAGVDSEFLVMEKQGHMVTFLNPRAGEAMVAFFQQRLAATP